jgi:hypothetical protein
MDYDTKLYKALFKPFDKLANSKGIAPWDNQHLAQVSTFPYPFSQKVFQTLA